MGQGIHCAYSLFMRNAVFIPNCACLFLPTERKVVENWIPLDVKGWLLLSYRIK